MFVRKCKEARDICHIVPRGNRSQFMPRSVHLSARNVRFLPPEQKT